MSGGERKEADLRPADDAADICRILASGRNVVSSALYVGA